jgi:hypothetical protein
MRLIFVAVLAGALIGAVIWIDRGQLLRQHAAPATLATKAQPPDAATPQRARIPCRADSAADNGGLSVRVAGVNLTRAPSRGPGGPVERIDGLSDTEWCLAHLRVWPP